MGIIILEEMYSDHAFISNILRILVNACSVITLQHSLLMQPHHFAIAYLFYALYGEEITYCSYQVSCLYFLCKTCKEVCIKILEVVSFHHLRVKFVTLQELLANNMRSLIRDLDKIGEHLRVIIYECQV